MTSDLATLVKQAADIIDVIGQVVPLKRSGNRYVGLCPFHQEKTPSFFVDAENQLYHCFGCGAGGDLISFVMRHQNVSFPEAVKVLADRYHISLPHTDRLTPASKARAEESRREKERIYEIVKAAEDFFYRQLHHSRAGRAARDYLKKRGLPDDLVEEERLGYAPNQWDALVRHLDKAGFPRELALKAGLLGKAARDHRVYDRFRNRLIFPIRDERERVVAFGGRSLAERTAGEGSDPAGSLRNEPKYLNSPETPVYHKGRMLYQLAKARRACREIPQVVLVEGYMDLLAFHAHGFYRVVATLGTALTVQQIRLLRRFADEVMLAYDADEAGERAMLRALPLFLQEQLPASCLLLPGGMDPDDFLTNRGLSALQELIEKRQDLGVYAVSKALERWDGSIGGKAKILKECRPIIEAVRLPLLKSEYLKLIGEKLAVPETVLHQQFSEKPWMVQVRKRQRTGSRLPQLQAQSPEEGIIRAIMRYPALIEEVKTSGVVAHFVSSKLKSIAQAILDKAEAPYGNFRVAEVYDTLQDDELRGIFAQFMLESRELNGAEIHVHDWVRALSARPTKRLRELLLEDLRRAEKNGDRTRVKQILAQMQDLLSAKRATTHSPENL